jgi:hypothetical protein
MGVRSYCAKGKMNSEDVLERYKEQKRKERAISLNGM